MSEAGAASDATDATDATTDATVRLHLRWGWTMLLVFIGLGLVLEALHGFKSGWYLDVGHEARRLMWRLGHAHGTLLSLVNLAFAFTVPRLDPWRARRLAVASGGLRAGSVLLPGGFVLGGIWIHGGDPGIGVLLVPIGAVALAVAVAVVAVQTRARG